MRTDSRTTDWVDDEMSITEAVDLKNRMMSNIRLFREDVARAVVISWK